MGTLNGRQRKRERGNDDCGRAKQQERLADCTWPFGRMTADVSTRSYRSFGLRGSLVMTRVTLARCAPVVRTQGTHALACRRDNGRTRYHER